MNAVTKSRNDEAADVKRRKKTRNKRKKPRVTECRGAGITPDESESCAEVVRACDLERDKASLKAEVDRLEHTTHIRQWERKLGSLADARDGLEHEHDVYKSKATIMIAEKNHHISELKDKVRTLEKRLAEDSLEHSRMNRLLENSQKRLKDH